MDLVYAHNLVMSDRLMGAFPQPSVPMVGDLKSVALNGVVDMLPSRALGWLDDGGSHYRMLALVSPEAAIMKPLLEWNVTVIASAGVGLGASEPHTVDWWCYPLERGWLSSWDENTFFHLDEKTHHIDVAYQHNRNIRDVDRGVQFMERHSRWRVAARERRTS
ncbi:MAG: hypothetical protein AAFV33_11335 [Chloroflexota bacterium]